MYSVPDLLFLSPSGHTEQMCTNAPFSLSVDGASSYSSALMSTPYHHLLPHTNYFRLHKSSRPQASAQILQNPQIPQVSPC